MTRISASGLKDGIRSGYDDVRLIIDLARPDPQHAPLPADRRGLYAAVIAAGNVGVFIPSRARGAATPMCKTALAFTIQQPETACHLLTTRGPSCTMDCGSSTIE
jgi:hypothetical protein